MGMTANAFEELYISSGCYASLELPLLCTLLLHSVKRQWVGDLQAGGVACALYGDVGSHCYGRWIGEGKAEEKQRKFSDCLIYPSFVASLSQHCSYGKFW